jgi:hypothetical protein
MTVTENKPAIGLQKPVEQPKVPRRRVIAWFREEDNATWLKSKVVAALLNILIAVVIGITVLTAGFFAEQRWPAANTWGVGVLKIFALWCFAFLPGWLYIRFLGMRARALWTEYVLTLHRLGWDQPGNLPEPVLSSEYHQDWYSDSGPAFRRVENIYQQKFEAYYGRQVTPNVNKPDVDKTGPGDFRVKTESLFPIFLATAVFAAGWAAVLWNPSFLTTPSGSADVLKFGFLGAYAFVVSMLIRRFFQSDLRPSAYAAAVVRVMLVLLIVAVLCQLMPSNGTDNSHAELGLAFIVGFFPLVGLQLIQGIVSRVFGVFVPSLKSDYPLDQLDGFDLWYQTRLAEEGIEDIQNLTTMNLVDVILHTRVPTGRLIDWIDQGFLMMHLVPTGKSKSDSANEEVDDRLALRRAGIRTASDLLEVFSNPRPGCERGERDFDMSSLGPWGQPPLPEGRLRTLVKALNAEKGMAPVWNWRYNGVRVQAGRHSSEPSKCRKACSGLKLKSAIAGATPVAGPDHV